MNSNEYEYMNTNGRDGNHAASPVVPLTNPGESGPVYPGSDLMADSDNSANTGSTPMIPLTDPGDDSLVSPGGRMMGGGNNNSGGNSNNNNNNNNNTGRGGNLPFVSLPNPGQGSPVFSGNNSSGFQGTVITVLPRPVTPCFYCNSNSYGTIRFLNAATGYHPFVVSINNRTVVDTLEYAEISDYGRISSGYQTITVSGRNGYIYINKQIRVTVGATMTIAIVNTAGGLDFAEISDTVCYTPLGGACLRVCNLSYNAGPLSLSTYSRNITFQNVQFMEVTDYVRVIPAHYDIFVSNKNEALLSTDITVRSGSQYTIYLFNWTESPTAIRTMIIEDRK